MGCATSSTSKTVILSKSTKADHDVDYRFGQVSIDKAFVDWSGNCGNLTAAVGSFAISNGLIDAARIPQNGVCVVRIWQTQINKTIVAHVRSEEHTSELQSLMRISYAVFCLKKKNTSQYRQNY